MSNPLIEASADNNPFAYHKKMIVHHEKLEGIHASGREKANDNDNDDLASQEANNENHHRIAGEAHYKALQAHYFNSPDKFKKTKRAYDETERNAPYDQSEPPKSHAMFGRILKKMNVKEESNMSNPLIEAASEFLSRDTSTKQTKNLNEMIPGYNPVSSNLPKKSREITSKVRAFTNDSKAAHIGATKEGHHVYSHGDTSDGEKNLYAVHHPDNKITTHYVNHKGDTTSMRELSKPENFHNVNKLPSSVRSIIHKDLKDNVDNYWN